MTAGYRESQPSRTGKRPRADKNAARQQVHGWRAEHLPGDQPRHEHPVVVRVHTQVWTYGASAGAGRVLIVRRLWHCSIKTAGSRSGPHRAAFLGLRTPRRAAPRGVRPATPWQRAFRDRPRCWLRGHRLGPGGCGAAGGRHRTRGRTRPQLAALPRTRRKRGTSLSRRWRRMRHQAMSNSPELRISSRSGSGGQVKGLAVDAPELVELRQRQRRRWHRCPGAPTRRTAAAPTRRHRPRQHRDGP